MSDDGLVGKLNGIGIGDVVLLSSEETESRASGYVIQLNRSTIKLSVEDPNHSPANCRTRTYKYCATQEYYLSHFEKFEVLKRSGE